MPLVFQSSLLVQSLVRFPFFFCFSYIDSGIYISQDINPVLVMPLLIFSTLYSLELVNTEFFKC